MKKTYIVISLLIICFCSCESNTTANKAESTNTDKKQINVGDTLHSQYFDIVVNKASVGNMINTGNEYTDVKADDGTTFFVLNSTFKNIDTESRMMFDGDLIINHDGKKYTYDHSETIMLDGFGLFLEQINPLLSKTTNLVYKIPANLTGKAYWHPARTDDDDIIFVGEISSSKEEKATKN